MHELKCPKCNFFEESNLEEHLGRRAELKCSRPKKL